MDIENSEGITGIIIVSFDQLFFDAFNLFFLYDDTLQQIEQENRVFGIMVFLGGRLGFLFLGTASFPFLSLSGSILALNEVVLIFIVASYFAR